MKSIARVATVAAVLGAGLGLGLGGATDARAEPRYHWCPSEQWSGWMGANWDPQSCHDDHYIDLEPHDAAHWHGDGPFIPGWPSNPTT